MKYWGIAAALLLTACAPEKAAEQEIGFVRVAPEKLAHGERVATLLGCNGCHGRDMTGKDWSGPDFGTLWTANLTRAIPEMTDAQLDKAMTGGVHPSGRPLWAMPSHLFTKLSRTDRDALVAFLRAQKPIGEVRPEPSFQPHIMKEIDAGIWKSAKQEVAELGNAWPPDAGKQHKLAHYIARSTCAECHGMDLRGGTPLPGEKKKPDLRIAAAYSDADFFKLLRTGVAPDNRKLGLMTEVAQGRFSHMTDAEITALHAYLKQVAVIDP